MTSAIIVAAGKSTRMGENKLLIEFFGFEAIYYTLMAFEAAKEVDEIILVAGEEVKKAVEKYVFSKLKLIVPGRDIRQESVKNGFLHISKDSDIVAIHDGARCLITPEIIDKAINECKKKKCVAVGVKSKDTVKIFEKDKIIKTIDREKTFLVGTPQIFKKEIYEEAIERCKGEYTDDCSMVEEIKYDIYIVDGGYENIKLTTVDDIIYVKAVMEARRKNV